MTSPAAFPVKGPVMSSDNEGMTLRDYFAAKAMQAYVLARPQICARLLQPQRISFNWIFRAKNLV